HGLRPERAPEIHQRRGPPQTLGGGGRRARRDPAGAGRRGRGPRQRAVEPPEVPGGSGPSSSLRESPCVEPARGHAPAVPAARRSPRPPRAQSSQGQSSRAQSSRGQSPRGQSPRSQSARGQSSRGQSSRGPTSSAPAPHGRSPRADAKPSRSDDARPPRPKSSRSDDRSRRPYDARSPRPNDDAQAPRPKASRPDARPPRGQRPSAGAPARPEPPPRRERRALSHVGGRVEVRGGSDAERDTLIRALAVSPREEQVMADVHGFHSYPARLHPLTAARLIEGLSEKGQRVLDPFCGSGTVLVEAR